MSNLWVIYGFPVAALVCGAAAFLLARHSAQSFDRKYGHRLHPGE